MPTTSQTTVKNKGGRPFGTASGKLSSPERRGYMTELWQQGLSDNRIAIALTERYKTFISKNAVIGARTRDGLRR